jgi:endonuclease/exonuclease/phosphatase family metal-dependent hydrolase
LAYIACLELATGNPFLIGFMHNMYNLGNKSSAYTNLGTMADNARNAIGGGYAGAEVIIGGDFNLAPRNPKRPRGATLFLYPRAARVGGGTVGAYINTTAANPYDFWAISNGGRTDAHVRVRTQTRVPHCSDHAGITLLR